MALFREITIPDEVLELARGPFVRPERVDDLRSYIDDGGTWAPEDVAASMVAELDVRRPSLRRL